MVPAANAPEVPDRSASRRTRLSDTPGRVLDVPTVCPKCEMLTATVAGCAACGIDDVLSTGPTFVVTGASGSGKTLAAHNLHAALPAAVVADSDNFLGVAKFGHDAYFEVLLEFAFTVIQGNRIPVLCGTLMPERLDQVPARDLVATITYINLDCDDDVRRQRLRARPPWRESSSEAAIERHVEFAGHLRARADMVSLDATTLSPREVAAALAGVITHHAQLSAGRKHRS